MKQWLIKIAKRLGIAAGILLLLFLFAIYLISTPYIQTKATAFITDYAKNNYGINAKIDYINLSLKGGVTIEGVYLPDEYGDTLAYIGKATVAFYPKKVYNNDFLSLRSVELDDAKAYLWNDTLKNRFCFDYIVEAFSSDEEEEDTTPSKFDMTIGSIDIKNLHFKYFVYGTPDTLSKEINYDYLDFSNINLEGELNSIKLDAFSASIDHLSLNEKSGLEISDLKVKDFSTTDHSLLTSLISLKSKNTDLSINNIEIESEGGLSGIGDAFTNGTYKFEIKESYISPSDFSPFYLPLQKLDKRLTLNTIANGIFPALAFDKLSAEYGGGVILSLSGTMQDYANFDKCNYALRIDTIGATADGLKHILSFASVDSLPTVIDSIFPVGLSANINGTLESLNLNTTLSTALGKTKADGELSMNFENDFAMLADAKLSSLGMSLNPILPDSILIDSLAYDLNIMYAMKGEKMKAEAKGVVNSAKYSDGTNNITLHDFVIDSASYIPNIAHISFQMSEPFAKANLATTVDFGEEKLKIKTNGGITYFKPDLIGMTDSIWERKKFSMGIDGDISLTTLNDLTGTIKLDSIVLADSLTTYKLGNLTLSATETNNGKKIDIASQILDATLTGTYDLGNLDKTFIKAINPYLPSLCNDTAANFQKNNFILKANIKDLHQVFGFFNIPIEIPQTTNLRLSLSDSTNALEMYANIPKIVYDDKKFSSNILSIKKGGKNGRMLVADFHSDVDLEGFETINLDLTNEFENDVILTNIAYNNNSEDEPILGNLKALLTFPKDTLGNTILKTFFMPSDLIMRDLWLGFEPSIITLNANGKVDVENFGLIADDDKRILNINGTVGEEKTDSVLISFDSLMIADVSTKLRTGVPISGIVNGDVCLKSLLGTPQYRTSNLCVNSLKYDNNLVGDMKIKSGMGGERRGIGTKIEIDKEGKNICSARGVVIPEQQLVRLTFETKELPINFAETFLSDYISDVKGTVSANINVNGKITSPFVNGYLYINDASAKVNYTNTSYRVNDSIIFTPEQFRIKDLTITDDLGHKAKVNCIINHNHLRDFDYMARISMDEFLLLNNPKAKNEMVYGKFMAGGRIRISGDEKQASIEGTISNGNSESTLTVVLPENETTAATYSNIVFVSKKDTAKKEEEEAKRDSSFKITTNVTLDIKDNLDMGVILSRSTGDNCKVKGEGNIRLEYSSEQSEPKLYGTYTISEGALKMKLSKLPLKPFSIEKGSNFNISGPISSLNFDIKSLYTTRADLATLDESFANDPSLSNSRVPVAAVLTIGGTMDKINLGYDITLPNSSEELKERVRSIVNTDELKICEFAYIIALNSFYSISGNSAAVSSTMLSSIASTSISNGMNTLLGDVLGSNWSVGADITSTESDMSDMEMSFTISRSFFNNRVVLSTDLGYQNQTNANGSSVEFTNNFDLEYKLTPSGMFRLKGYRHDNDEFYRQNSSKQGVGFLFTREAPTFYELFKKGGKK